MTHPGILYPKLTVIGCGLIGGSVIRAAREHGVVSEITVADASAAHRARVVELGIAEHVTDDIAQAVKDADLVVIATPVLSTPYDWVRSLATRRALRRMSRMGVPAFCASRRYVCRSGYMSG